MKRPEDMFPALAKALQSGDVESALQLYEPNAVFVTASGDPARGADAMRAEFQTMIDSGVRMSGEAVRVIYADDLALVMVRWHGVVPLPAGSEVELDGMSTDILRRQADETWLSVLDNPIGTALASDTLNQIFARALAGKAGG